MVKYKVMKWNYRIIFAVNEETITVSVVEITHASQNPEALISRFKK